MNLKLTRKQFGPYGIFGELHSEQGQCVAATLEHAFYEGAGRYAPKLATGTYTCKRGQHRLHSSVAPFETFEVKDVPPFAGRPVTGILIHQGNYDADSDGCILVGECQGDKMICSSRAAFARLMEIQAGVDEFTLNVE